MTVSGPDGIDVLFTAEQIAGRVEELAGEIVAQIDGDLLVVVILKGSFVFAADLIRALDRNGVPARVDFITLSSYQEGTESSGRVVLAHDLSEDVKGQDVLIVDDILESGRTLDFACSAMADRGAASVRTCLLLDKPARRKVPIEADFVGFSIAPEFVVGYGLDLAHRFRGLPFIGLVREPTG
ncbi:MAG: hypoxanthine phosphoribosyltransferase [Alphaproteobacteria bacterium]|jgi:hypoxanthine phosphoribosyltransferase